jgi:hypothetical protein
MSFRALLTIALACFASTTKAQSTSASSSTASTPSLSSSASASDAQTSTLSGGSTSGSMSEILGNKKFQENEQITDAKLKAEEGSFSRYSLKFNLSYYGPTLNDFSAADQPNVDKAVGPYSTSLGGSMSGRYRISSTRTISMGTGMKANHPFHGMDRFDMNNPYLSYDMSTRIGGVQMRNSPGVSIITIPNYTQVGEYGAINWDNSLVYDLGRSRFAVALDTGLGYFLYNRGYEKKDGKAARYNLSVAPSLKYNFTDKFSMNTSFGFSFWNPRQVASQATMWNRTVTQRIGFGYALTRDVYFAPYFNFYPSRIASDTTTLNFSTIFSIL